MKKSLVFLFLCISHPLFAMEANSNLNEQLSKLLLNWRLYQCLQNSLHLGFKKEPGCYEMQLRTYRKLDQDRPTRSRLRELIAAGADVNYVYGYHSMLHWAADSGLEDACFILLDAGANPNTSCVFLGHSSVKSTPLLAAIYNKLNYVCLRLIEKGADIDKADAENRTPLYHACLNNLIDVCEALIQKGADINTIETTSHWTPLMLCASKGNYSLCKLLLRKGANMRHLGHIGNFRFHDLEPNHTMLMIAAVYKADNAITAIAEHLLFPPYALAKTFMLCLLRMGQESPSAKELFRQGKVLLAPYILFNIAAANKAVLLEYLKERDAQAQLPWVRYPIAMLNPECIDITIQTLIHKELQGKNP